MPVCPKCGNRFQSTSFRKKREKRLSQSQRYVQQVIDQLALYADPEAIREAVTNLLDQGWHARNLNPPKEGGAQ